VNQLTNFWQLIKKEGVDFPLSCLDQHPNRWGNHGLVEDTLANAIPSFIFNKKSADTFKKYSLALQHSAKTLHTHIINPKMTL